MGTTILIEADTAAVTLTGDRPFEGPTYDELVGWIGAALEGGIDLGFEKRPGAPGVFEPEKSDLAEGVISIEGGKYFGATRADALMMRETLTELYNGGRAVRMTVSDDLRTTSRWVKIESVDIPWTVHPEFEFAIDMRSADPYRYGEAVTVTTPLASAGTGLALPSNEATGTGLDFGTDGLDFGTIGIDGRVTLVNNGNAEALVTFTVDATSGTMPDGFLVVNVDTGEQLPYLGGLDGVTVTLDGRTQTAFVNDVTPAGRWLANPQWWTIPPRSTRTVAFVARGPVTGDPQLGALLAPAFY